MREGRDLLDGLNDGGRVHPGDKGKKAKPIESLDSVVLHGRACRAIAFKVLVEFACKLLCSGGWKEVEPWIC